MVAAGKNDAEDFQVEKFRLNKIIKELRNAKGAGTSMISLIIPPKDQISRISSLLLNELSTASNIKSRVNRQSVLAAITSAQHLVRLYNHVPKNGLAIFTGTIFDQEGKEKKLSIDIEPFKPLAASLYLCDNKFHIEELERLCDDDEKYGFVIMDGNGCLIGTLAGQARQTLFKNNIELPKKHGRGGQSAPRFERIRQEARHNYVTKTAENVKSQFIDGDKVLIKGLVLAGSADFKTRLSESPQLDYRLRDLVIAVVDVGYGHEQGFSEAIEKTAHILGNVKHVREEILLRDFFSHIDKETGLCCLGVDATMAMLMNSGVKQLLLYEDLDYRRILMHDPQDDSDHVFYAKPGQLSYDKYRSKITGQNLELIENNSLLDFLCENYTSFNCQLSLISDKTERGHQFAKSLGGIAAILHYKFDVSYLPDYGEDDNNDADANNNNLNNLLSDDTDDIDAL